MILLARDFLKDIYTNRYVIAQLTRRDLQNRYIASVLGFFWYIVQPLVMLLILWFVLGQIFHTGTLPNHAPFVAWLITGVVIWNFFVEAVSSSTNVFQEFSYLVKKINFRTAILPLVKISSAVVIHGLFLFITIVILLISGVPISLYWLQVFYYLSALIIFLCGVGWLLSALNVFVRDVTYAVTVVLQFLYWLTPLIWDLHSVPQQYQVFFKLNPLFYIVEGYRDSLLYQVPFWHHLYLGIYFWSITFILLLGSVVVFRRLRPHFADVL